MGLVKGRILTGFTKGQLFTALFTALFCLVLFGASSVSATSPFDDTVKTTNTLIAGETENTWVDLTNNYIAHGDANCTTGTELTIWNRFKDAITDYPSSRWAIKQMTFGGEERYIEIAFTDSEPALDWNFAHVTIPTAFNELQLEAATASDLQLIWLMSGTGSYDCVVVPNSGYSSGSRNDKSLPALFANTFDVDYPDEYEGEHIPGEVLNSEDDTDGDGILDKIESPLYPLKNDLFCSDSSGSSCAYPNPAEKDLYIEIDWMENLLVNYKPNSSQVAKLIEGLDDLGYNVYVDTGDYGGGGALSDYIETLPLTYNDPEINFFDLMNGSAGHSVPANFAANRKGIWRYVISGYEFSETEGSSGGSYPGSGTAFISYGYIEDHQGGFNYNDLDTAIAGTLLHEIGHSICLSDTEAYTFQSNDCIFDEIDKDYSSNVYDSVMNYYLQMFQYKLSDGSNGNGDHDDWGAIDGGGIADFSIWNTSDIVNGSSTMHPGITLKQALKANREGRLGKVKRGNKIYDLKNKKVIDLRNGSVKELKESY